MGGFSSRGISSELNDPEFEAIHDTMMYDE